MNMTDHLEVREGICEFRPRGESSLVEAVELIAHAIAYAEFVYRRFLEREPSRTGDR